MVMEKREMPSAIAHEHVLLNSMIMSKRMWVKKQHKHV